MPTPNINSIGHDGVSFANGYAGNATCAPSRAAIMTGRYPTRFGFEFTPTPVAFEAHRRHRTTSPAISCIRASSGPRARHASPWSSMGVPASETTIAEVLRARGYHTLQFGKWHLGAENGMRPEQQGLRREPGLHARRVALSAGERSRTSKTRARISIRSIASCGPICRTACSSTARRGFIPTPT